MNKPTELRTASEKLYNEVCGLVASYEDGLRELMGNTNYAVLLYHANALRAALTTDTTGD
jgi:hypothetical protein